MSVVGPIRRPVVPPVVQPTGPVGLPWESGGGGVSPVLPTANLIGDYDGTHVTLAAGRVSAAVDQSSSANDVTQGVANNQPLQSVGGGVSGANAIDFALNGGNITNLADTDVSGDATMTIYYVGASPGDLHYISDGVVGDSRAIARNDGAGGLLMYAGSVGPAIAAPATGTSIVLACVFNGASSKMSLNGGAAATGNVGAGTDIGLVVGSRGGGAAGTGLEQKLTRLLVYSVAHDDATRANVVAYLRWRYAL